MFRKWEEGDPIPVSFDVGTVTLSAPSAQRALSLFEALVEGDVMVTAVNDETRHCLEVMAAFEAGKSLPLRPVPGRV